MKLLHRRHRQPTTTKTAAGAPHDDLLLRGIPEDEDKDSSSSSSSSHHSALTLTERAGNHHHTNNGGSTSNASVTTSSSKSSWSLARTETLMVLRSKALVLMVLTIATIICGVSTYIYVRKSELRAFQIQFTDYANEVIDVSHVEAMNLIRTIQAMSALVTSTAIDAEASFPNVTVRHFDIHGTLNNNISNVLQLTYAPIVKDPHAWESYVDQHKHWIDDAARMMARSTISGDSDQNHEHQYAKPSVNISHYIHPLSSNGTTVALPVWQQAPVPYRDPSIINMDLLSHPVLARIFTDVQQMHQPILSEAIPLDFLYHGIANIDTMDDVSHPHSFVMDPIYATFDHHSPSNNSATEDHSDNELVGVMIAVVAWDRYFEHILHEGTSTMTLVLHNSCGDEHHFTYMLDGPRAIYVGGGDLHDTKYSSYEMQTMFAPFLQARQEHIDNSESSSSTNHDTQQQQHHCDYELRIYPTAAMHDHYTTNRPILYAWIVVMIFSLTVLTFLVFDYTVAVRQRKVMAKAHRTHAIVSSLFPSHIRDQLIQDAEAAAEQEEEELKAARKNKKNNRNRFLGSSATQLKSYLGGGKDVNEAMNFTSGTKPIAELFPHSTIMFGDIGGFTAWSSAREPCQVFMLLETIYQAFDEIAKRRRVFKVETVGDCYVAVAGVPDPRPDHAVVMARYAHECLQQVQHLTRQLETTLGPDTADLTMRFGLHSGPVTAGVLRGDKGRFQLFGDTVNTAARMENTGAPNSIHCSNETATLLREAGKDAWIHARDDVVYAKGKGELQTYWIEIGRRHQSSVVSGTTSRQSETGTDEEGQKKQAAHQAEGDTWATAGLGTESPPKKPNQRQMRKHLDNKEDRLIDWNTDILCRFLKKVVAYKSTTAKILDIDNGGSLLSADDLGRSMGNKNRAIEEVVEIIELPELDPKAAAKMDDALEHAMLDTNVMEQVRNYVQDIAALYPKNHFHNFEHASHVAMSVSKLLSRIVAPTDGIHESSTEDDLVMKLHEHTYGITSDPLTQFACVFTALIHDVDHAGVPNQQLVKENAPVALEYEGKSVAEQNSIHLAWELFMKHEYTDFRWALCPTTRDMKRFRQLIVNTVLATDIMDKDLKQLRNQRWTTAFNDVESLSQPREQFNRKATIVLEHLIQASDIAHTMQHWSIYQKWNERLFQEMLHAYHSGRSDTNPADNWSKGEVGFFDFYVIPLAKKLKDCGAFGVCSDEYLSYAQQNRMEWERRGSDIVAQWVEKHHHKNTNNDSNTQQNQPTENNSGSNGGANTTIQSRIPHRMLLERSSSREDMFFL